MRILLINNFHYLRGGSDRVYFETARILKNKGHEVGFFSTQSPENEATDFSHYFVKNKDISQQQSFFNKVFSAKEFVYNPEAVQKLEKLLSEFKPHIVHLHIFQSRLSSAIIKTIKKSGIPSVMTVHEYKMLCPVYICLDSKGEICEKCANGNYIPCITNKCTQNSYLASAINAIESKVRDQFFNYENNIDAFVYPSQFIKNKHTQYKDALKNKSYVIHNFIDLNKFSTTQQKEDYYLYYGRLSREKGVPTLINAWKKFPHLKLKIVGSGPEENLIKQLVKELNLSNVELLGAKYGNELTQIIQKAKFTLVPSEWYETFGLTIIESYACGTPVIAAAIGGIEELVDENKTGFLFESHNENKLCAAIQKSNTLLREEYNLLSKFSVEKANTAFTEEKYYDSLIKVYTSISLSDT